MDKFQGIFDKGFSGIFSEPLKNTMPGFIEKLAEQELNYEPVEEKAIDIPFEKNMSLTRANELTSRVSRNIDKQNRFSIEKNERESFDQKLKEIDKSVESMLSRGKDPDEMQKHLLKKYPKESLNKYFESKIKLILNKFSFLGFLDISEKEATIVAQSKIVNKIKRAFVTDLLKKFAKLEYVDADIIKSFKERLKTQRPLKVALNFLFSIDSIKKAFYKDDFNHRIAFSRDVDKSNLKQSNIKGNNKRNKISQIQYIYAEMLSDYKKLIYSKNKQIEISKKMAKTYGIEKYEKFVSRYSNDIKKIAKFYERQNFCTDFTSLSQQGFELRKKNASIKIDVTAMLNHAFNLMSQGEEINFVKDSLKKKFGFEATKIFLNSHEQQFNKHYGQLGYVFIDSNIYSSCNEMQDVFLKMQHTGSKLIFSLKSNSKCKNCTLNKKGECQKVNLLISNNPIVRSSRAAKRIFNKALSFLPENYVESFIDKIKKYDSNRELIAKFALGMNNALNEEKKNIGKKASKDRSETTQIQEDFLVVNSFNVDLFKNENTSKLIDSIMNPS